MKVITPRRALAALAMTASLGLAACGSTAPAPTYNNPAAGQTNPSCQSAAPATRPPANVVVHGANSAQTVKATVGQIVELQLPFGRKYAPFPSSDSILVAQQPSNFPDPSVQSCIFRFKASQAGTTALVFISSPVCNTQEKCPQNEVRLAIPVQVQS